MQDTTQQPGTEAEKKEHNNQTLEADSLEEDSQQIISKLGIKMSNRVGLAYQAKKRKAAIKETENAIIGENRREHVALTRSAPD